MRTILEQTSAPISYDERLLAEERSRWPGWEPAGASEAEWRPMHERERAEWELADVILCGSQYVADAVAAEGGPGSRCKVVPYASPREFANLAPREPRRDGPLRVLFVGTLQLRKGVQYLIETCRLLKERSVEVRLVGPAAVSGNAVEQLRGVANVIGSVPRCDMRGEYERADVLVLPTLSEGSANVCYEALASGLPVITTPNAGSVVRDGIDGYLVPIRSPEALAERIARLDADRHMLEQMSSAATSRAEEFTWARYCERLIAAVAPPVVPSAPPVGAAA
jgi:glycosyltransferase involved in cell wall biosynthesis